MGILRNQYPTKKYNCTSIKFVHDFLMVQYCYKRQICLVLRRFYN